ncbi:hypothetical protein AVEN_106157-1 [Araneus ventricosus]|uniref:Uncharacterized protein n=1 Tax=Araneus ventricosus TaxID=182803 RepID=A0A4Y2AX53_ARAVE|nr:hypothetical protein AVEN_106157-1 [Araneus ventricosus]
MQIAATAMVISLRTSPDAKTMLLTRGHSGRLLLGPGRLVLAKYICLRKFKASSFLLMKVLRDKFHPLAYLQKNSAQQRQIETSRPMLFEYIPR